MAKYKSLNLNQLSMIMFVSEAVEEASNRHLPSAVEHEYRFLQASAALDTAMDADGVTEKILDNYLNMADLCTGRKLLQEYHDLNPRLN